jgi:hypothetical protein
MGIPAAESCKSIVRPQSHVGDAATDDRSTTLSKVAVRGDGGVRVLEEP